MRLIEQSSAEAVLNLRQKYNLEAGIVEQLIIHRQGRGHSGPLPRSGLDGKFSVEYCAAAALLDGQVVIDTFTDQRRFARDMEETLRKVSVDPVEQEPGVVRVEAKLKDAAALWAELVQNGEESGGHLARIACFVASGAPHSALTSHHRKTPTKIWRNDAAIAIPIQPRLATSMREARSAKLALRNAR